MEFGPHRQAAVGQMDLSKNPFGWPTADWPAGSGNGRAKVGQKSGKLNFWIATAGACLRCAAANPPVASVCDVCGGEPAAELENLLTRKIN